MHHSIAALAARLACSLAAGTAGAQTPPAETLFQSFEPGTRSSVDGSVTEWRLAPPDDAGTAGSSAATVMLPLAPLARLTGPLDRPAAAVATPGVLPQGEPIGDYDRAFAVLRIGDYDQAAILLQRFTAAYPADPLAANVRYWLGEVWMIRGDYPAASSAFAEAARTRPDGPLAERALAMLAVALRRDGRREEACGAIRRLDREHPSVDARLGVLIVAERRRLSC